MKDVISIVDRVRLRAAELNRALEAQFGIAGNATPLSALNMAHQDAVVMLELLSYYDSVWGRTYEVPPDVLARIRQENGERVVHAGKSAFSLSLSSYEFGAKCAWTSMGKRVPPLTGRIYLDKISRRRWWSDPSMTRAHVDGLEIDKDRPAAGWRLAADANGRRRGPTTGAKREPPRDERGKHEIESDEQRAELNHRRTSAAGLYSPANEQRGRVACTTRRATSRRRCMKRYARSVAAVSGRSG